MLLFLPPIGNIKKQIIDGTSQIIHYEYDMIEKNNLHLIDNLLKTNEEGSISKNNYLEFGELLTQKQYCSSNESFLITFKR